MVVSRMAMSRMAMIALVLEMAVIALVLEMVETVVTRW